MVEFTREPKDAIDNSGPIARVDGTAFVKVDGFRQWVSNADFPMTIQSGHHSINRDSPENLNDRWPEIRSFCDQAIEPPGIGWFMVPNKKP